jgi:hypothetical protein
MTGTGVRSGSSNRPSATHCITVLLPLPCGEGWGEGNLQSRISDNHLAAAHMNNNPMSRYSPNSYLRRITTTRTMPAMNHRKAEPHETSINPSGQQ